MTRLSRRSIRRFLLVSAACALLAGCGTASTGAQIEAALTQYNASRPHDLAETGRVCRRAADQLRSSGGLTAFASPPSSQKNQAHALDVAMHDALAGFADCDAAASTLDYPRMVQAVQEIAQANAWLATARTARS